MKRFKRIHKGESYDACFKYEVLAAYYSSGKAPIVLISEYKISRATLYRWLREYENGSKALSLSEESIEKLNDMRKKRIEDARLASEGPEALKAEILRLRKALEFSELRNEALEELLRIGREEYGLDLLKKAGAKQ